MVKHDEELLLFYKMGIQAHHYDRNDLFDRNILVMHFIVTQLVFLNKSYIIMTQEIDTETDDCI